MTGHIQGIFISLYTYATDNPWTWLIAPAAVAALAITHHRTR